MKFPKAKWNVVRGRMVFDGVAGKVEYPPTAPIEKDDEKEALVRQAMKMPGHAFENATQALHEHMQKKDTPVSWAWCNRFVLGVIKKDKNAVRPA